MNERWKQKKSPASLETRFNFDDYDKLRTFLDELAEVAENLEHHPNISFSKSHVSVIIYSTSDELNDVDVALADGIDKCFHRFTPQLEG